MSFTSLNSVSNIVFKPNPVVIITDVPMTVVDTSFVFPTKLGTITWDASTANIAKSTFQIPSGIYSGNYEILASSAVTFPRFGFDSSNVFSTSNIYYEKRDTAFWYSYTNNQNAFVGNIPTSTTQFICSFVSALSMNTAPIFNFNGTKIDPSTNQTNPYNAITEYTLAASDAQLATLNKYVGSNLNGLYFTTNYTNAGTNYTASGEWIQIKLPDNKKMMPYEILFNCLNTTYSMASLPLNAILLGSDNGLSWNFVSNCVFRIIIGNTASYNFDTGTSKSTDYVTIRDTTSDSIRYSSKMLNFVNSKYTYFRLVVLASSGGIAGGAVPPYSFAFTSMRIAGTLYTS